MAFESRFFAHPQENEGTDKVQQASSRSPATVCAAHELHSAFRGPDDAVERGSPDAHDRRLGLAPRLAVSFPLDGESSEEDDDDAMAQLLLPRRARPTIFRSVRGPGAATEHRRDPARPAKRRACGPMLLRRATPIDGDEEASPCKRLRRSDGFASAASPFTALFAAALPASGSQRRGEWRSIAPQQLLHPLSVLDALPLCSEAATILIEEDHKMEH